MGKKEGILYVITIISFIAFVYIAFGAVSKIPSISDNKFMSLTGNVVLDLEDHFKIGDTLKGDIIVNQKETNESIYGMILLTKDNDPIIIKTFNLKEVLNKNENSGGKFIRVEEMIEYRFEESGSYELLFSVLDLNMNIKREIIVE